MMRSIVVIGLLVIVVLSLSWRRQSSTETGAELYKKYCLSCHQSNGAGVPKINPALIRSSYVLGSKKKLIEIVLRGSEALDEANRIYKNPMAPIDHLTDQQIAAVLTYVRNSFGNKASAVSSLEVKNVREKLKN